MTLITTLYTKSIDAQSQTEPSITAGKPAKQYLQQFDGLYVYRQAQNGVPAVHLHSKAAPTKLCITVLIEISSPAKLSITVLIKKFGACSAAAEFRTKQQWQN